MSLSIANYSLLQCIFIIIHLGLNISWKKFTIPNLRSQIYSKNSFHKIYHSTKHNKAHILLTFSLQSHTTTTTALLCPPHWGVDILFLPFPASAVRHTWFPVISRASIYPIFTKFGMGVYWVNSLHGIAFGEDNFIAN